MKQCFDCGAEIVPSGGITGCGLFRETVDGAEVERSVCFPCCGKRDEKWMRENDRMTLYYTGDGRIINWPGSLEFKERDMKVSRHNIARVRYSVWFNGPDGSPWYGVQYGDNTQLLHCRKLKKRSKVHKETC